MEAAAGNAFRDVNAGPDYLRFWVGVYWRAVGPV